MDRLSFAPSIDDSLTTTGTKGREEPAIAMWELCNEPRLQRRMVGNNVEVLHQWMEDTAALVSKHTDDQLISTGMEGYWNRKNADGWWEDGSQGTDFVRNHEIDEIDACSFHMYPQAWGKSAEWGTEWIEEHAAVAHEKIDKPVYAGEFSWTADRNDNWETNQQRRQEVLKKWYSVLTEQDVNGAFYWQIRTSLSSPSEFALMLDDEVIEVVDKYTETARKKSEAEW